MKKAFVILFLGISLTVFSGKLYISPSGNDVTGNGSISFPYFTLTKAWSEVSAGDTIYVRGGTYEYSAVQQLNTTDGSAGNYINVWAYPGEQPIITRVEGTVTGSSWPVGLIRFSGTDYVYVRGLEITGFIQDLDLASICSGLVLYNSDNCIIERINSHHNGHGIMVYECANPQILYCDTHHNYDPIDPFGSDPYGDADGLEVTDMGQGTHTIIRGHRSWNNSDDGIDLWDSQMNVTIENSWCWNNGYQEDGETEGGDGNGFKLGRLGNAVSKPTEHLRTVTNCLSFYNRQTGFNDNLTYCIKHLYNNTSYSNGDYGYIYFNTGTSAHIVRNNIGYGNPNNGAFYATSTVDHNTFLLNGSANSSYTVNNSDFVSTDSTGISGARQSDGSLPNINFMRLADGSDLLDAGYDVGIPYYGPAPDIGAFEYGVIDPPPLIPSGDGPFSKSRLGIHLKDSDGNLMIIQ